MLEEEENKIHALRNAIQEGIDSGIAKDFNPKEHLEILQSMVRVTGQQIMFLPELIIQSFLLSISIFYWYQKPRKTYNILTIILVALILLMSIAGYFSLSS